MTEYLWKKSDATADLDQAIHRFSCGNDLQLDQYLLPFDLQASQAHVRGLARIEVLTTDEAQQLCQALDELSHEVAAGRFQLQPPVEDGHSAIELWLSQRLGELGRRVHAGRSRNDQVQTAMRLYLIDALRRLRACHVQIAEVALQRAESSPPMPMPGYTHLQRAVPSSAEFWWAGFVEAFIDLAQLAELTLGWIDALPLGTAAGYGVNLPLDREGLRQDLGMARIQLNPQYVQNSRGRFELQVLMCMGQSTLELRRLAWDLSLYTSTEFGFVQLPDAYTTGSSIMPNKRNPDVIELLRGQHAIVQAAMDEIQSLMSLPSGYQRDLQLTKAPTIRGIETALAALALVPDLLRQLTFDPAKMRTAISPEMYATDIAIERVQQGTAFRDAYREPVTPQDLANRTPEQSLAARVSLGSCGNLALEQLQQRLNQMRHP